MESNKYYTPEIEEFFVGFEYELRQADIWQKEKVQYNDCFCDLQGDGLRVKYLDKEDIESLGWTFFKQINLRGVRLCFNNSKYRLDYLQENNYLIIQTNDYIFCKYNGIIKNKSELKKLMQQLKIDDTQ